jgi:hypothetical protein
MRLRRELLIFLIVSGIQSVANYGTYALVLLVEPWWVAFLFALIVGISLQTILQFKATFGYRLTFTAGARYIVYQVAYATVFGLLLGTVISFGVPAVLGPLVVLVVVTPFNFLFTRLVITRRLFSASTQNARPGR